MDCKKLNTTHGRSALKGNNDQIADDRSVSKDKLSKHGNTFVENNAMDAYVPDKNYDPEWMEMDGDYKKTVTKESKWTYLDVPPLKEGMYGYNGPGPCLKNLLQQPTRSMCWNRRL